MFICSLAPGEGSLLYSFYSCCRQHVDLCLPTGRNDSSRWLLFMVLLDAGSLDWVRHVQSNLSTQVNIAKPYHIVPPNMTNPSSSLEGSRVEGSLPHDVSQALAAQAALCSAEAHARLRPPPELCGRRAWYVASTIPVQFRAWLRLQQQFPIIRTPTHGHRCCRDFEIDPHGLQAAAVCMMGLPELLNSPLLRKLFWHSVPLSPKALAH